jgi:predicted transcriptional regulator
MEVIRVIKNKNYTTISNQLFKNKGISLKAKGLMGYLLSLPSDWNLSINGIVSCSKEGRTAIRNVFTELINAGYIERKQIRNKGKFVGYDYFVFEQPKLDKPTTVKCKSDNSIQINKEVIKERINKNTLSKSEKFKSEVFNYDYPKSMLEGFYDYWSEPNKSKTKERWQLQPTFEIGRRLKTWAKREKSFKPKQTMSKIDMHLQSQKQAEELLKKTQ